MEEANQSTGATTTGAVFPGGGLLTYVSEELTFRNNGHSQRGLVELLSVSIQQTGKIWLTLNNLYIPPGEWVTDLSWISVVTNTAVSEGWQLTPLSSTNQQQLQLPERIVSQHRMLAVW